MECLACDRVVLTLSFQGWELTVCVLEGKTTLMRAGENDMLESVRFTDAKYSCRVAQLLLYSII